MNRILSLMICFLVVAAAPLMALSDIVGPQQRFALANELLEEGRTAEALAEYQAIEESGFVSGALHLNAGIAAVRLDSLGLAWVSFYKSSEFSETVVAAREGLAFVDEQLARRGARLPELPWIRFNQWILFDINYSNLSIAGIVLFNLGIFLFIVGWLRERFRRGGRLAGISLALLGLLVLTGSLALTGYTRGYSQAVQIVRETQVHEMPNTNSEVVQTGFEGFRYIVNHRESDSESGWLRVRMVNGSRGWVQSEAVYRH